MENQNNPKYPKYLVSLSNTLIKLYSSVKGPEVFHDLLPKESQSSKSLEVDPYLLLSKVNVLTSHLSQVKVPENGLTQSLACSDSTDYEKDENRTVKIESNFRDTDSYRSGLTMKDQIDMIGAKARKFEEESNDCNKSSVESDQDQIQIKIPNSPKKMKKSSIKKNVQPSQRNYWDQDEDQTLLNLVETYGEKWTKIANILGGRTGKQVRDRYINYLRPTIKRREWTLEEETKLHELYSKFGNKWSTIAMYLNGRTENQVKNRFYAAIRKQKRPAADNHTYANDEEPELAKFVKMEPSVAKKNDFNTKTELFTKSEDPDAPMKHEYLDFSNSINSIKFEPKEEYEKMSQIQEQMLPNMLFNAINENQKRLFMQSGFQQKKYSLLKLGATGRGGFTNNNTEESIELPSEYSNKFLLK